MNRSALRALLRKELLDLSRNRAALFPVALVTVIALIVPFAIAFAIPVITGEALANDSDLVRLSAAVDPGERLEPNARVQLFLLQQFLMLFLLTPITGAMALASHSVVGEKQARTLEPLLAAPISTVDLLMAKVLGALLPTLVIAVAGLVLYSAGIAVLADSGVLGGMITLRTLALMVLVGPATALTSLQAAILISSRVNDPRTAQQFGVFIVVPISALLVAQFTGAVWLSAGALLAVGAALLAVWLLLLLLSVLVFDRETILTRWR
jgi:ABC-2 type transport system permease protein